MNLGIVFDYVIVMSYTFSRMQHVIEIINAVAGAPSVHTADAKRYTFIWLSLLRRLYIQNLYGMTVSVYVCETPVDRKKVCECVVPYGGCTSGAPPQLIDMWAVSYMYMCI